MIDLILDIGFIGFGFVMGMGYAFNKK